MFRFDLQTLLAALITMSVAIGVPLALISGPRRGTGALWYWALTLLALAGGSLLLVLRDFIPTLVSVMFGNTLIICALALLGNVASSLTKQFLDGTNRWFFAAITAPFLGFLYLAVEPLWPRVAYMAAVECYLVGQLAWQLRRSRVPAGEPQRKPVFAFEVLLWIFFAETVVRIVSTIALTPGGTIFEQFSVAVAFLVAILLVAVGTCILIWHELDVKDDAIRAAKSTDIDSGLPNRAIFLQLLEGRLGSMVANGNGIVALLRLKPAIVKDAHLDPYEEVPVYRNAGIAIERALDQLDVLARVSDDEFGILIHGSDIAQATQTLRAILSGLETRGVEGERGRYIMNGSATLTACGTSTESAAEVVRILRDGLSDMLTGEVRVLVAPTFGRTENAAGSGRI